MRSGEDRWSKKPPAAKPWRPLATARLTSPPKKTILYAPQFLAFFSHYVCDAPRVGSRTRKATQPLFLFAALVSCGAARAQQAPSAEPSPPAPAVFQNQAQKSPSAACLQPPPVVRWQDYKGPLEKTVGIFGSRLERKSVHPPHYKPGAMLCTLEPRDKLFLFFRDTVDPLTFLSAGFNAGLSQAQDDDPSYGQGAAGYGKRFGFSLIDQAQGDFFGDFLYPTIFSEDPRYYRLAHGSTRRRLWHVLEHAVVAYHENGESTFNFSLWLGTTSSVALANVYHPDYKRGVGPAAARVGFNVGQDIGFDILREFWPEIARKFKLPFRQEPEVPTPTLYPIPPPAK